LRIGPVDHDLILSVGRVERYKGHWRLVEAMPQILAARPTARLRVVGDGPDRETLMKRSRELGVAHRVEIAPIASTDRAAMVEVLSSAGVVALLSDYEAQGISAMEALGLGRPVVVADSSGLRELAANGWARAIPTDSSREEIASALLDELDRPPGPNRRFQTWDDAARRCAAMYREVLARAAEVNHSGVTPPFGSRDR
jgi:glycosyltransferase involved in cell wall biosynthesis